jgi:hypothetical protein
MIVRPNFFFSSSRFTAHRDVDDDAMEEDSIAEASGNRRRRLWKASCTAAALTYLM